MVTFRSIDPTTQGHGIRYQRERLQSTVMCVNRANGGACALAGIVFLIVQEAASGCLEQKPKPRQGMRIGGRTLVTHVSETGHLLEDDCHTPLRSPALPGQ